MERRPLVLINGMVSELPLNDTLPGDFSVPYSKRIDFISDNEFYKGEATPGVLEAQANWRISKVTIAQDGDVQELWASGTASFDKQWALRTSYVYS